MKIYHVFPLLLMLLFASCSKDNQVGEFNQEEVIIETRRATRDCTPKDIPCSEIGSDLERLLGASSNETAPFLGKGTRGVLDNLINCKNPFRSEYYCYRNCHETIDIWEEFSESVDHLGCSGAGDTFTAAEQLELIEALQSIAEAHAPICPIDGTQMIPLSYDVYAYPFNPAQFSTIVRYGSACTEITLPTPIDVY